MNSMTDAFGMYRGYVVDNNDPDKLGRVRIQILPFFRDYEAQDLPWAVPAMPLGGAVNTGSSSPFVPPDFSETQPENDVGYGSDAVGRSTQGGNFVVPQNNSWVWCFFEAGDRRQPVYFAGASNGTSGLPVDRLRDYPNTRVSAEPDGTRWYYNAFTKDWWLRHASKTRAHLNALGDTFITVARNFAAVVTGNHGVTVGGNKTLLVNGASTTSVVGHYNASLDGGHLLVDSDDRIDWKWVWNEITRVPTQIAMFTKDEIFRSYDFAVANQSGGLASTELPVSPLIPGFVYLWDSGISAQLQDDGNGNLVDINTLNKRGSVDYTTAVLSVDAGVWSPGATLGVYVLAFGNDKASSLVMGATASDCTRPATTRILPGSIVSWEKNPNQSTNIRLELMADDYGPHLMLAGRTKNGIENFVFIGSANVVINNKLVETQPFIELGHRLRTSNTTVPQTPKVLITSADVPQGTTAQWIEVTINGTVYHLLGWQGPLNTPTQTTAPTNSPTDSQTTAPTTLPPTDTDTQTSPHTETNPPPTIPSTEPPTDTDPPTSPHTETNPPPTIPSTEPPTETGGASYTNAPTTAPP